MTIRVSNVGKCYPRYERPVDRLRHLILPAGIEADAGFWALRDIDFELPQGGSLAIVGKNGSGKSTLLQLICGTTRPTVGQISIDGRIGALLELGSGFNPEFTGRENVYLNASLFGLSRAKVDERFEEIESFADIGAYIDQPVKTYSSGMVVRLAFAVQVQLEPEILVVDEALAVGDALFQKRCFQRIEALRSKGTSLLFVSHDEESVRTLTRQAILLNHGRIAARGASSEVLLEYRRQLHEDETAYMRHVAQSAARHASNARAEAREAAPEDMGLRRSDSLSFGHLEAEVLDVRVLNADGAAATVFYPTELVRVEVDCVAHQHLDHLNVALRLRSKEGVKLYSWGTLNQDIAILAGLETGPVFWERSFAASERFTVSFEWICGLGVNLYEIQAAISREGKPYYADQRVLHWRDEAAFFHVSVNPRQYHFGGVVDLRMRASASHRESR